MKMKIKIKIKNKKIILQLIIIKLVANNFMQEINFLKIKNMKKLNKVI
jgi:hypothetical protein